MCSIIQRTLTAIGASLSTLQFHTKKHSNPQNQISYGHSTMQKPSYCTFDNCVTRNILILYKIGEKVHLLCNQLEEEQKSENTATSLNWVILFGSPNSSRNLACLLSGLTKLGKDSFQFIVITILYKCFHDSTKPTDWKTYRATPLFPR